MAITRIHAKGPYTYDEATAGGTITPGMLVKLNSSGQLIAHNEQGGRGEAGFALEDALQGKAVGDNYSSGNLACYILPGKGCEVYALLKDQENVSIGDELVSAGDGTLQARGSSGSGVTEWQTIGYAMETKDLTADSAQTAQLMRVRIV